MHVVGEMPVILLPRRYRLVSCLAVSTGYLRNELPLVQVRLTYGQASLLISLVIMKVINILKALQFLKIKSWRSQTNEVISKF